METLINDFYSNEALALFAKKPPLAIRWGCALICLFIIILTISSSLINVPYIYKIKILETEEKSFVFENEKTLISNEPFKILLESGEEIIIHTFCHIQINNIAYIQVVPDEHLKSLIKDRHKYQIIVDVSLLNSYLSYLFCGV